MKYSDFKLQKKEVLAIFDRDGLQVLLELSYVPNTIIYQMLHEEYPDKGFDKHRDRLIHFFGYDKEVLLK